MAYETMRLLFGMPAGLVGMAQDKTLPMEANVDLFNGIDWQ